MYINKPEEFIVPIKLMEGSSYEYRDSNYYRGEDETVKTDVSSSVFNSVLQYAKKGIESLYNDIKTVSKDLTAEQIKQLHMALMREFFIITLKKVNFLESLRIKYLGSDVKEAMSEFNRLYDEIVKEHQCDKDMNKTKKISNEDFVLLILRFAEKGRELMDDIYDKAEDFSIPQVIELLQDMGKDVYDVYVKNVPCLSDLKGDMTAKNKYYNMINSYVVALLEEAKKQEELGKNK